MSTVFETELKSKHIVIVGGGSGIGKATAKMAAALGAKVTIASRSVAKLQAAADEIGNGAQIAPVDTTDEARVTSWARRLGPVDHLVISASSAAHGAFTELPTDDLRTMFEAKFIGPYVAAREVLPALVKGGSVTFFSGVLSRRPSAGATGLGAVNAAVEALAKGLALELSGRARVNCISPGMVATEAYTVMPDEARDDMYAKVGASLPVGRVGVAEEVAQAVILAMTNGFLTGTVLDIDGGHLVRG
ncbi:MULTISPECIES: SDR family oxidoreductase [unclassified Ruegeria]|uniref:SDR family oxidoreductase n=1 Tax=unclassified Ruegeria TaxID=2625375 RepID=UPI0014887AD4|nr:MULTISPECIES: SDR family oxidoreductase [unclassified Ruegeria]NOD35635.1 SDR family oxidoreductase [Ruegeria sp. HKCCD7296]NOE43001.1 SDR family oxidoreductase [Ruegeria sp. HKCCD7319]